MPLILPGNVASATASTGYDVANSCRFNDGDSPSLTKTATSFSSATTGTFSFWIKRGALGATQYLFANYASGSSQGLIKFNSDDTLTVNDYDGTDNIQLTTNRVFRDPSAWMSIVLRIASSESTEADRARLYINGTQETSFATETYPTSGESLKFFANSASGDHVVGANQSDASNFDGYLAECVYCDGQSLGADSFGEFDSDSPTIFKPIDVSGLTFGNNGWYLDFEDSDNLGDDESGNASDFTSNNLDATDSTTDVPTNNWCTLNPLTKQGSYSLAHGNTYLECNDTDDWELGVGGTIGAKSGKYYWEVKQTTGSNPAHTDYNMFGFNKTDKIYDGNRLYSSGNGNFIQTRDDAATGVVIYGQTGTYTSSVEINGSKVSIADDDIVSFALDLDNRKCWMGVDGVWVDDKDGNTNGASINTSYPLWGTGEITADTFYTPASIQYYDVQCYYNFGNPAFTISSGNADANGYGNMEYAIPDGYYCLCLKNLAEFG